jgi:hypothetical protein
MKLRLTTMCLFISLFSMAQKNNDSTVTIIFSGGDRKSSTHAKKKIGQDNIIKLAPTGIFVGQIPIIYERKFTPNISIQLAVGLTNQNYVRTAFARANQIYKNNATIEYPWAAKSSNSDYVDDIYIFDKRKAEMGTMFSIQPKFYTDDDALDGAYVGFSYNSYNYKFTMPGAVYSTNGANNMVFTGATQNEFEKITDFMLHYGRQNINGHFAIEYSTALGLRKISGEKYGATTDNGKVYDGMIPYSKTLFNYEVAIRVGYVF